jgi:adenylate cyclase
MNNWLKHWPRMLVTLLPLVFALLHAAGALRLGLLDRLDNLIYDARLNATMPRTLDSRVVIVDIDEKSLAEAGRWPWGRDKVAAVVNELFERQKVAVLGFDVVFAEPDDSSGLKQLRALAETELQGEPGFTERLAKWQSSLDFDAQFAKALTGRPVVLGYYLTSDQQGRTSGQLPAPVMTPSALQGRPIRFTSWDGFGANIPQLAQAAPQAGFFNSLTDTDGVVRSVALLSEYKGSYYESLSLAIFRLLVGLPKVEPGFPREKILSRNYQGLESVLLAQGTQTLAIPVDDRVATLIPFRGPGGPAGGSYRYVSASDVLAKRLPAGSLEGKIVLVGATAPGLLDLRVTPVAEVYPGVETHANLISGLLDGRVFVKPDYALGYDVLILLAAGLALALALPMLSAPRAVLLSLGVLAAVVGLNFWLYLGSGLVMPLATALVMILTAFALNMSFGYFVESRSKRELANLFGTYVPPELVDEMVKDPDSYSMQATSKELTVLFCDMRGFTKLSETMDPTQLQALLNSVFSRLTYVIRGHRGTIDKYMGDCVMAFWGAPVDLPRHASLAVQTALQMAQEMQRINQEHAAQGLPQIGVGIGINTGLMCVGDMGSELRRSYTVIGDAVNLGSRVEALSRTYGVDIVVTESTRRAAPEFAYQELDRVRVKGKDQAVAVFSPLGTTGSLNSEQQQEQRTWQALLKAYRTRDWEQCDVHLLNLERLNAKNYLYELYAERVASARERDLPPDWDAATQFDTK